MDPSDKVPVKVIHKKKILTRAIASDFIHL
jgi:hypothetical protein